jgi:hypothetical protein
MHHLRIYLWVQVTADFSAGFIGEIPADYTQESLLRIRCLFRQEIPQESFLKITKFAANGYPQRDILARNQNSQEIPADF